MLLSCCIPTLLTFACAHPSLSLHTPLPATALRGGQLHGHIIDMRSLRLIDFATLVHNLETARLIAIGEEHYHSEIQAFEHRLLQALAQKRPQHLALAMEFLEQHHQETVDAYLNRTIDENTLHDQINASDAFQRLYTPLINTAQQARLPIIAMNIPRRIARQVAKEGFESALKTVAPADRTYVPTQLPNIPTRYRTFFLDQVRQHHPVIGEQATHFTEASFLKDVTMAHSLSTFLDQHPQHTILAIAGRFHVDFGIAIPALLRQQYPQLTIQRLTTMSVSRSSTVDLKQLKAENIADYIQFVAPANPL